MQSDENLNRSKRLDESTAIRQQKQDIKDTKTNILAWILLTFGIGLCIIASIICIFLWLNEKNNKNISDINTDINVAISEELTEQKDEGDFNLSVDLLGKQLSSDVIILPSNRGCYESSCHMECSNNEDLFKDTAEIMNLCGCVAITSLDVSNQIMQYLENKWIGINATVLRIVLRKSQFMKIKSGAFASTLFSKVFHMTWIDLELNKLSDGALLGLYSLRILEINSKLPKIGMSFLQPVQLTLTHLSINSGIEFQSNSSIFENIYLEKLNHLDLSHNKFSGTLSKNIFKGTPNVSYLYLRSCQITWIADDAFEDLANKLILVDLKHNLISQINDNVFPIGLLLDLEPNNWNCNCELQSLLKYYDSNKSGFVSTPYCRAPYHLYGKGFDELSPLELTCDETTQFPYNVPKTMETKKPETESNREDESQSTVRNTKEYDDVVDENTFGAILQFSCSEAIAINTDESSKMKRDLSNQKSQVENTAFSGTFVFEPPVYDLNLNLFDNFSIQAEIDGYDQSEQLNILWFTDNDEMDANNINFSETDYNCMQYEEPYLIIDPLKQNHTYTFCMMPLNEWVISPLYCQPLHIPLAKTINNTDEIWISDSDKQFTIAMLCLIFFISTVFGAVFAYLGIKSFPHLLEGSKNVLIIKESEKICNISTIADPIDMKKPLSNQISKTPFNVFESNKTPEATTEPPNLFKCPSSSTCFEESFSSIDFQAIEYEMPMQFEKNIKEGCNLSQCLDKPKSPPPLPKRNSSISLIPDRQSTK